MHMQYQGRRLGCGSCIGALNPKPKALTPQPPLSPKNPDPKPLTPQTQSVKLKPHAALWDPGLVVTRVTGRIRPA